MRMTLRDIAQLANVSPATVSNALNGRPGVSKEVRAQILAIAQEMGYQLNREAQRPSRYVRLIIFKCHGMVVMDTPFFSELIQSIQLECRGRSMELLISHISVQEDADYAEQIRSFNAEGCAGVILLGTEMSEKELRLFDDLQLPMVVLDNIFRREKVHSVVMNNLEAGRLAAKTLYEAGHRSIGHITSSVGFSNMTDRLGGFREGLQEHGLTLAEEQVWPVRPTMNGAYEDMLALLQEKRPLPTAFFAGNDIMAIGCMRALVEKGYRVPEDVSFIGMDNTVICEACTPQLSTIQVYKHELGVVAMRTLLSLVDETIRSTIKVELGVDVVKRGSIRHIK